MIKISVVLADVAEVTADVLLLKYARRFHGADQDIAERLFRAGKCVESDIDPAEGAHQWCDGETALGSRRVLFLGTTRLGRFRYGEIRSFAKTAIEVLAKEAPDTRVLATTVHGAGYGLDIEESLRAMLLGFQQGLALHSLSELREVVIVERDARRFEILGRITSDLELTVARRQQEVPAIPVPEPTPESREIQTAAPRIIAQAETALPIRSAFVAMPFTEAFEDVYEFGIYATVRRCGFACERVDQSIFAGSIVDRIMDGIRAADFLIADLTDERPNVYLEVGYAWGLGKPVITLAREGQRLHFDVSHHRCIFYRTIGKLSQSLEKTISEMFREPRPSSLELRS